jgi:hypothetical protein
MTKFMSEKAVTANPRQAAMNVGDFRQWLALKMGRSTKGYETSYSHLDHFASGLKVGQTVSRGDVIGFIGTTGLSTGPHLHFQYYMKGVPVDPLLYMQRQTVTLTAAEKASFSGSRSELVAALTSAGFSPVGDDDSSAAQQR